MKIYMPNIQGEQIGGGFTFLRNFRKGLQAKFVDRWEDADIVFIAGVTMVERSDIEAAHKAGKPIVFRADNVPRKSRNRRSRVFDNMRRYAEIAHMVVYQSQWAKEYCQPVCGDGEVILNGVDTSIFYPATEKPDHPIYLFAYHGKNDVKNFWLAHYLFQRYFREDPRSEFWFIYNFRSELEEQINANYDFWNGEKFRHLDFISRPEDMADLMRQCTHLIYPAYCDAAPNVVLEARACGLEVVGTLDPAWSGVAEVLDPYLDISLERMCREYLALFELILNDASISSTNKNFKFEYV